MLSDQRTLAHLDWVHEQLAQAVEDTLLRDTLARLWSLRQAMAQVHHPQHVRLAKLVMMEQVVCQRLCAQWEVAYARVAEILGRVMRASSAVEGLNSVLRMHQARQRHDHRPPRRTVHVDQPVVRLWRDDDRVRVAAALVSRA